MSNENVSLPVAEALASALSKIEAYVPTEYVDNSEPDINAEHLNHAEQGIMRVTNLLNAAVDVIQGQESRLADAETKIGTAALTGGMTDLSSGVNSLYSNLAGNYITKANGYKKISGVSDTKKFDPNVLGCCFLNGSTANLPTSYDSTYIALANGLSMCIPYFENGFVGMYVRTYNGQWFPWQKII